MGIIKHFQDEMSESVVQDDFDEGKIKHFQDNNGPRTEWFDTYMDIPACRSVAIDTKGLARAAKKHKIPDVLSMEMLKRFPKSR